MWSAIFVLGGIALISALGLGVASRFFAVEVDPKIKHIEEILPGANCGGCGFAGCVGFAEAVVAGKAGPGSCAPGGLAVAEQIGRILGIEVESGPRKVARLFCRGGKSIATDKFIYTGVNDCRAAALLSGGPKACTYGCLGLGTCISVCHFGAIRMGKDHLPIIDPKKCTGCGKCVSICPKNVLKLLPEIQKYIVLCNSHEKGKKVKEVCKIGCIACQICAKKCPSEAINMDNSLAVIDYNKCTACGVCWEKCPQKTIWTYDTVFLDQKEKDRKEKIVKTGENVG